MAIRPGKLYMWDVVHLSCVFLCLGLAGYEIDAHSGYFADNHRQQSVLIDGLPSRQRREIQKEILTLLGLDHKPKPIAHVKKNSAPKYMLDLYNSLGEDGEFSWQRDYQHHNLTAASLEDGVDKADMIMSFVNRAGKAARANEIGTKNLFYFDFSEVPATKSVSGAELRVFKKSVRKLQDRDPLNIQLYRFIHARVEGLDYILQPEVNVSVLAGEEGWLHLSIRDAATQWTYFPAENLGLYIKITDKDGKELTPHEAGIVGRRGEEDKQPFMVAFFEGNQELHIRKTRAAKREAEKERNGGRGRRGGHKRRGVSQRQERSYSFGGNDYPQYNQAPTRCARRTLYVNFKDLGWQDWIIAPDGYTAYFCFGQCQFPLHEYMNATNHAIVQVLVHITRRPGKSRPPMPCCAPRELSPINVLYFDDNSNVILMRYRNMVVKDCGCQ